MAPPILGTIIVSQMGTKKKWKTYDQNGCIRPPQILGHEGHKKILSTDTHHSKCGSVPTVFNNCPFETSTEKEVRVGPFAHLKDQGSKGCIGYCKEKETSLEYVLVLVPQRAVAVVVVDSSTAHAICN